MDTPSATSSAEEKRRFSRVHLTIPAQISRSGPRGSDYPAHLRDVSASGAFCYTQLVLTLGSPVRLSFHVPVAGREVEISCEGSVVRLEAGERHAGVAIQFARLQLGETEPYALE
ncbi:MAG TPA: PilZ domain-containing protein [Terriglobales bacterium]|nr:PilZ domain-containing protein [Terriglobales bacterium]